jgi:NADH-quinone oxidoreductase subunit N
LLFAIAGMMLMATATDLLVIFLALEVLSLAVYVLTGIRRRLAEGRGGAAASSISCSARCRAPSSSTAIAFTYGLTGHAPARPHWQPPRDAGDGADADAAARRRLVLVGFAFKVSAVPFHMWTPDAYEGAPPAVTAFMSTGVKAAPSPHSCACSCRRSNRCAGAGAKCSGGRSRRRMIVGTVVGVAQTNVKRMLAYSSIAHGGYLLVALVAAQRRSARLGAVLPADLAVTNIGAVRASSRCSTTSTSRTMRCATTPGCGTITGARGA